MQLRHGKRRTICRTMQVGSTTSAGHGIAGWLAVFLPFVAQGCGLGGLSVARTPTSTPTSHGGRSRCYSPVLPEGKRLGSGLKVSITQRVMPGNMRASAYARG